MKLYLSGPITGVSNYREIFRAAAEDLARQGHRVINPAELCEVMGAGATYEEYLTICLGLLDMAEALVQLPEWETSPGANRELGYAIGRDLIVVKYEDMKGGERHGTE